MNLGPTNNHYRLAIKELRKLKSKKKLKMLEIGAGSKMIKNFLPENIQYDTLDYAEDFWKDSFTYNTNIDKEDLPIENESYDIIICHETLEHVMYPEKVISEIKRVAKKDAIFFLSMPNEYNFIMRLYYLIGKKTKVDEPFQVVTKNLHIHKPRVKDIINIFSKYFYIEKTDYIWQSRSSEKSQLASILDKTLQSLANLYPNLFSRVVAVKCIKKINVFQ
jgi:ubiquinone/menaquinone biosynthesis C-methylase UbiE